jgi:hypothetical protein
VLLTGENDLDQINGLAAYFDFAVNEQCFEYSECAALALLLMLEKQY